MRQLLDLRIILVFIWPSLSLLSELLYLYLDKGSNAGDDCESENYNLSSVVNPEHLASELSAVLHHKEDDDDDDSADQAEQPKEQSWIQDSYRAESFY